jgi:hypothetical protein
MVTARTSRLCCGPWTPLLLSQSLRRRSKEHGLEALNDRSRRPVRYANQLPQQIESLMLTLKHDKPHWGARKIREAKCREKFRPNNVYQHRNTQHPDNVTEQAANGTEGVEGYFRHNRRSAITRSTPIAGSQRSPHWLWL